MNNWLIQHRILNNMRVEHSIVQDLQERRLCDVPVHCFLGVLAACCSRHYHIEKLRKTLKELREELTLGLRWFWPRRALRFQGLMYTAEKRIVVFLFSSAKDRLSVFVFWEAK